MNYFWTSFTLQIIVYSYLTHVIIKYWNDWWDNQLSHRSILYLLLSLISCAMAIHSENRRNFESPLKQLEKLLEEFKQ